jgi:uncharacterized membrane protein
MKFAAWIERAVTTRIKDKLKPAVPRRLLLFIAGAMWCGVGVMLSSMAFHWLSDYEGHAWPYALAGFATAMIVHHFGFLRIVDKNLGRISQLPARPCAFSFISWKSYLIIIVMVTMGITLRHSPIPRQYLSVIYIAIGMALFLSSIRYFRNLVMTGGNRDDAEEA